MIEMWMGYRCFRKYFDTVFKPKNGQLTEDEKDAYHYKADCNSFLEEYQKCCLCEFPLEAKVLNSVDKPNASCSCLNFFIRKESQFLKNILLREEIETARHLNSLSAYYDDAMSFLLKEYEFFIGKPSTLLFWIRKHPTLNTKNSLLIT